MKHSYFIHVHSFERQWRTRRLGVGRVVLRLLLHPSMPQRFSGVETLSVLLHQQLRDEINALGRHIVERFIIEVIFSDRHVAHRLHVTFAGEGR